MTGAGTPGGDAADGPGTGRIRVLLADDQALVRGALAAMLGLEPDIEVVAQVGSGEEVVATVRRTRPDVVLLDIQMPGRDGLTTAAELRGAVPHCRVIMLTTFGRPGYLTRAMAAGAVGFVVKDTPPERLVDAVRKVHAGLHVVDPQLAAASLSQGISPLSARECQVLLAAAEGGTVGDVARRLHLSEGTVRNHLSAAIGKTGARTRAEAARIADEHGWL
ncbi:response regulator transcription factor [Streptosporangium roseum]|uniref:response regulator transcription factor n=1 Tax=Streptosporangium roseum TaxID=2001 RepID=UPI003321A363